MDEGKPGWKRPLEELPANQFEPCPRLPPQAPTQAPVALRAYKEKFTPRCDDFACTLVYIDGWEWHPG